MDQITPSIHAATPESARARLAALNWEDPFGIDSLLTDSRERNFGQLIVRPPGTSTKK